MIEESKIKTETEKPLTTSIDYEKVPEVLKTIMVTLEKNGKFFSFLLRINQEKTVYSATLMPPEEPGVYPLTITILDYKNQALKKITGQLIVFGIHLPILPWYKKFCWFWILLIILILITTTYFIRKKLKKKKEKEKITPPSL